MINRIQSINSPVFNAWIKLHPNTVADEKVYKEFWERTQEFPTYTLIQERVSATGKDVFNLRNDSIKKMVFQDDADYTSSLPQNNAEKVNRFLAIFNQMYRNAHNLSLHRES